MTRKYVYKLDMMTLAFVRRLRDGLSKHLTRLSPLVGKDQAIMSWYKETENLSVGQDIGDVFSAFVYLATVTDFLTQEEGAAVLNDLRGVGVIPAWEKQYLLTRVAGVNKELDDWLTSTLSDWKDALVPDDLIEPLTKALLESKKESALDERTTIN
jgi:hypothetical protein